MQSANPHSRHEFLKWYHVASLGQALQALESTYLRTNLNMAYGTRTLQVGRLGCESRYIDADFVGGFALLDRQGPRSFPTFVQGSAGAQTGTANVTGVPVDFRGHQDHVTLKIHMYFLRDVC